MIDLFSLYIQRCSCGGLHCSCRYMGIAPGYRGLVVAMVFFFGMITGCAAGQRKRIPTGIGCKALAGAVGKAAAGLPHSKMVIT